MTCVGSYDFVGVSHSSLLDMIRYEHLDPTAFLNGIIEFVEKNGATHNQRTMLHAAYMFAHNKEFAK